MLFRFTIKTKTITPATLFAFSAPDPFVKAHTRFLTMRFIVDPIQGAKGIARRLVIDYKV